MSSTAFPLGPRDASRDVVFGQNAAASNPARYYHPLGDASKFTAFIQDEVLYSSATHVSLPPPHTLQSYWKKGQIYYSRFCYPQIYSSAYPHLGFLLPEFPKFDHLLSCIHGNLDSDVVPVYEQTGTRTLKTLVHDMGNGSRSDAEPEYRQENQRESARRERETILVRQHREAVRSTAHLGGQQESRRSAHTGPRDIIKTATRREHISSEVPRGFLAEAECEDDIPVWITRYQIRPETLVAWTNLGDLLQQAATVLLRETRRMYMSYTFVGHLTQASAMLMVGTVPTRQEVFQSLRKAREWLLISAALLSFTIARYRHIHPEKPEGWHKALTDAGLSKDLADNVYRSVVSRFRPDIRRVGAYVLVSEIAAFQHDLALFQYNHIPLWFKWDVSCEDLSEKLSCYFPSSPMQTRWTPEDVAFHPSRPNAIVPPVSRVDALLDCGMDWRLFMSGKASYAVTRWTHLTNKERGQICRRLRNAERGVYPLDMNAMVWVWFPNAPDTRTPLLNAHDIDCLIAHPAYCDRYIYDPIRNEFDFGADFPTDLNVFTFVNHEFGLMDLPDDATREVHNSLDVLDESPVQETPADDAPMNEDFLALLEASVPDLSTIQGHRFSLEDLHSLQLSASCLIMPFRQAIRFVQPGPLSTMELLKPDSPTEWQSIKWMWGYSSEADTSADGEERHIEEERHYVFTVCKKIIAQGRAQKAMTKQAMMAEAERGIPLDLGAMFCIRDYRSHLDVQIYDPQPAWTGSQAGSKRERNTSGRPSGPWYILTRQDDSDVLVVYDAVVAHHCVRIGGALSITAKAKDLIMYGMRFSVRKRIGNPLGHSRETWSDGGVVTPQSVMIDALDATAEQANPRLARSVVESQLSAYSAALSLGLRDPSYSASVADFIGFICSVRDWCGNHPHRAAVALRNGGIHWRLVSCFVDVREVDCSPGDGAKAMPRDMWIVEGDTILVDEYLTEEESQLLSGAYSYYENGVLDLSKANEMRSWLPRFHHWEGAACNTRHWTADAEQIWNLLTAEITSGRAQPRTTSEWKKWAQGQNRQPKQIDIKTSGGSREFKNFLFPTVVRFATDEINRLYLNKST